MEGFLVRGFIFSLSFLITANSASAGICDHLAAVLGGKKRVIERKGPHYLPSIFKNYDPVTTDVHQLSEGDVQDAIAFINSYQPGEKAEVSGRVVMNTVELLRKYDQVHATDWARRAADQILGPSLKGLRRNSARYRKIEAEQVMNMHPLKGNLSLDHLIMMAGIQKGLSDAALTKLILR